MHFEVAYSLDTDAFLNAFFRMTSCCGLPTAVVSDNGTNFIRAKNELKELKNLDTAKIKEAVGTTHFSGGGHWKHGWARPSDVFYSCICMALLRQVSTFG